MRNWDGPNEDRNGRRERTHPQMLAFLLVPYATSVVVLSHEGHFLLLLIIDTEWLNNMERTREGRKIVRIRPNSHLHFNATWECSPKRMYAMVISEVKHVLFYL